MAENREDLATLRQKLGIGDDVSDAALETLLSSKNGKDALKKIEAQPTGAPEGGLGGFLHDKIAGPLNTVGKDLYNTVGPGDTPAWLLENIGGLGVPELVKDAVSGAKNAVSPSAPKAAAKKPAKDKPLGSPQDAATNAPESPFTQLAQALASEYLGQVQQLMPLTSGSGLFGPQGATTDLANQAAATVGGPSGSWLQGLASQEQSDASKGFKLGGQNVPGLQQSMNQVGEAASKGAIGMSGAIANMGPAETQYLETAPWQQLLNELASTTAYKASTQGGSAFGLTPQNTPAWLSQILQSHGLGTAGASGLVAPGTAAKGGKGSTTSATSSGTSQTG